MCFYQNYIFSAGKSIYQYEMLNDATWRFILHKYRPIDETSIKSCTVVNIDCKHNMEFINPVMLYHSNDSDSTATVGRNDQEEASLREANFSQPKCWEKTKWMQRSFIREYV